MNTAKWIVIAVLVLALSIPATPVSAAGSASLTLTPPQPNPGLIDGDVNFALVVNVTDVTPGVAGVEIYLSYDDTVVAPPASPTGAVEALPDFFGPSNVTIPEILAKGQCPNTSNPCIHLVAAGPAQTTQSGAVARFHFRGKTVGTAKFSVVKSILKNADGYEVVHTLASDVQVPIVFLVNVYGIVQRQGTPGIPNPGGGTPACSEVKLTPATPPMVSPVQTNPLAKFSLTNVPPGTYTIHAEYPGYLASEKSITTGSSTSFDAGTTTLRGGDVNADKAINILDIGAIISKFSSSGVDVKSDSPDCTDPDVPADINDDGNVNISDLAIAAGNWGQIGPKPWP